MPISRKKFMAQLGAKENPQWSWSFSNPEKKEIYFGAWENERDGDYQLVLSDNWSHSEGVSGSRKINKGYRQGRRHIRLLVEDDEYKLFTFRQYLKIGKKPRIERIEAALYRKKILKVGADYYAIPFEDDSQNLDSQERHTFEEGRKLTVIQTKVERSVEARQKCLSHFGSACQVCGFDFGERFGPLGAGFIHVHHVVPLSQKNGIHEVDPIRDLVPLCPNCHAMAHSKKETIAINELKTILKEHGFLDQEL